MAWWRFGKRPRELVSADWMGEKLAEMFDPTPTLNVVIEAHPSSSSSDAPFLALGALRLVGFQLGAMQKSVVSRIEQPVMERIQLSYVGEIVKRYVDSRSCRCDPRELIHQLLPMGRRVYDAFMDNRDRASSAGLHPAWFAAKEVCIFLSGGPEHLNPGEIMNYSEFLHDTIVETKKLFDELLDARVGFTVE
jgi:hypothetical protein